MCFICQGRKQEALVVLLVPGEHPFLLAGMRRVICVALTIELLDRFDLVDLLVNDIIRTDTR